MVENLGIDLIFKYIIYETFFPLHEFTYAFKNADKVILLPIYTAGEKISLGFKYENFAREIIKNSKVKLFLADDRIQLAKYIKNNIYGKKIVIGMGAGTISTWMREMPKYLS